MKKDNSAEYSVWLVGWIVWLFFVGFLTYKVSAWFILLLFLGGPTLRKSDEN